MNALLAKTLFDLSAFQHAAVFDAEGFAWLALERLEKYLSTLKLGVIEADVHPDATLINPHLISLGKGTVVEAGAYIKGPCVAGKECVFRQGCYVRGNLLAGDKCVIGHASEIKHVIMLNNAQAPHFNYVGDSILGHRVNLGAGSVLANLRFDKKDIIIHNQGQRIATGLHKFGAILGDDAQTGCNSVTNPGTIFGKKACCRPTANVGGIIPPDTCVHKS